MGVARIGRILALALVGPAILLGCTDGATSEAQTPVEAPVRFPEQAALSHLRQTPAPILSTDGTVCTGVWLEVTVDAQGAVEAVKPTKGVTRFYATAVAQASTWTYAPFVKDGHPVPATFTAFLKIEPDPAPQDHVDFPEVTDRSSLLIRLRRDPGGFGGLGYEVDVHGDGTVVFMGTNTAVLGRHVDHIDAASVSRLIALFRDAHYFSLRNRYATCATDLPTEVTSFSVGTQSKEIERYGIKHPALINVENGIDQVAGTAKWVRGTPEVVASLRKEGLDFKSKAASDILASLVAVGTIDGARAMLAAGVPLRDTFNIHQALIFAGSAKTQERLRFLLEIGVAGLSSELKGEALYWAARQGDLPSIKLLLR
ncbi:MAG: hypothetical protein JO128_22870, partial [Alphaproteobacteria bacterium]|nr:hypothetical protein [Alphaproteobacteria bacterium]